MDQFLRWKIHCQENSGTFNEHQVVHDSKVSCVASTLDAFYVNVDREKTKSGTSVCLGDNNSVLPSDETEGEVAETVHLIKRATQSRLKQTRRRKENEIRVVHDRQ